MPVTFRTPSETGGVIVKEILVSDDDPKTNASRRGKFAIKIRILPRKKRRPNVSQNLPEVEPPHYHHHQQLRQHGRQPKRTRFSCCSAADDDNEQLQHYDVAVADDVTYWSAAATAPCISYSSCDLDSSQLRGWNVEEDTDSDDGRRRRTARHSGFGCQHDVPKPAGEEYSDEVFEDVTESGAAWRDVRHHREALRSMNVGSASDQRRQRVSQPPPPRHRPGGPRPAAPNAGADQGQTGRRPAPLRRALTDLEAAEVAAGYPEVYYVGDAATVNAEESVRQHSAAKKTQDSGSATRADDSKTYDDEDGYYIHVPHDQIAYRYEVFKVLGRGSFGQVVRAFDHKTRSWVALKIVRSEERFRRQALDEVRMLSLLSRADSDGRSHVVRMVDHFEFRRHPCIVFEPLGVDLYEALKRRGYRGFPLTAARRAAYGIARCLQLLSRHGIIHCDLKPENVLLTVPPPHQRRSAYSGNNINVKVIDFGSSCYETDQLYVYVQSRFYRAPEVILGARYGTPVDMWSLGCIVAELITGRPLFAGDDETDQLTSQLEYLGMPPARLLARSRRAAEFFSTTTNLPRYCSVTKKSADDDEDNDDDSGLPSLTGSLNKSGTYRCPPGDKDLDAALLNIIGREPGAMDRRHRDYIEFVRQCVEWEPSARMTPEEALLHPWMQHDPTTQTRIVQPPPRHRSLAQARRGRPAGHADENDYL